MNREQIIEALASALMNYRDASGLWGFERAEHRAAYSLTALETAIPGLADVIRGTACIVPAGHSFECAVNNETIYPAGPARPK